MPNFHRPRGLTRAFRLTPSIIVRETRRARDKGERVTLVDTGCPGLRLVIGARTATWSVTGHPRGHDADGRRYPARSVTIGDARELDPESARQAALAVKREIALGHDPVAERRERRRQEALAARSAAGKLLADAEMLERLLVPRPQAQPKGGKVAILDFTVLRGGSLAACGKAFLLHGLGGGRLHARQTASQLRLALAEMGAGDFKPAELGKHHVRALVDLHAKAARPATARHRHAATASLLKWLLELEVITDNVAARVPVPPPPTPRSHVPSAANVRAWWETSERLTPSQAILLKLAILLPLRRQELANLRVANIVHEGSEMEIRLAPEQVKNRMAFTLPVVGLAKEIVEQLLLRKGLDPQDLLIPLAGPGKLFSNWSRLSAQVEREADVHLAWHNLRRLFASETAEHGIGNPWLVDALLNHQKSSTRGGTMRSYHHGAEKGARRSVMEAWNDLILHAVEHGRWPRQTVSEKVIPLRKGMPT